MKKEFELLNLPSAHSIHKKNISVSGLQLCILIIINFSIMEIITSSLSLKYFVGTWLIFTLPIYLVLYFTSKMRSQRKISWLIIIITVFFYLYFLSINSSHGFKIIYDHIILIINALYGSNYKLYNAINSAHAVTSFLSLLTVFLTIIFHYFIVLTSKTWLINLLGGSLIISVLFLGVSASSFSISFFIISCLFHFFYFNTKSKYNIENTNRDQSLILLSFIALLIFTSLTATIVDKNFKFNSNSISSLKQKIQDFYTARDLFYPDKKQILVGGIAEGKLHQNGILRYLNIDHLKVTVDEIPSGNIYLKSFIGDVYYGEYWQEINQNNNNFAIDWDILNNYTNSTLSTIKIEKLINSSGGTVFFPYAAAYNHNGIPSLLPDYPLYQYEFTYFPDFYYLVRNDRQSIYDLLENQNQLTLTNSQKAINKSNYPNYLNFISPELEALLKENFYDPSLTNYEDIIQYVQKTLDVGFRYSLNPGRVPDNQDYISYFLLDSKIGYCVHYATAATLLFRLYGIPSRYVEGYVVNERNFIPVEIINNNQTTLQYVANVKDRRAHAWSEIYLDGFGWIPIETTPVYIVNDTDSNDSEPDLEQPNNTNENQNNNQNNNQQNSNQNNNQNNTNHDSLPINKNYIYSTLLCLSIILVLIRRKIIIKARKNKTKQSNYNLVGFYLFNQIDQLHQLINNRNIISLKAKLPSIQEFNNLYPSLNENNYKKFRKTILKMNYSTHQITKNELLVIIELYNSLVYTAYPNFSLIKKLNFLLIKCFVKKY